MMSGSRKVKKSKIKSGLFLLKEQICEASDSKVGSILRNLSLFIYFYNPFTVIENRFDNAHRTYGDLQVDLMITDPELAALVFIFMDNVPVDTIEISSLKFRKLASV